MTEQKLMALPVKTDSIFFEIFKKMPQLFFEILGEPADRGNEYEFSSVEIKQTAFRIDGVFTPKPDSDENTAIFLEIQFQKDQFLYERLFSEVMLYMRQYPEVDNWRAIAVYPRRSIEQDRCDRYKLLLKSEQFQAIYLEDFLGLSSEEIGIQMMQLIISKEQETDRYLNNFVEQLQGKTDPTNQEIIKLISTIMVYKFPQLNQDDIEAMFTISDLKQTRVYQDARVEGLEEGRIEEAKSLISRQLNRRFGELSSDLKLKFDDLSLEQIEELGEALLDFEGIKDLQQWLSSI